LVFNPYKVVQWHYEKKTPGLLAAKYHALLERASEIGDESLAVPAPVSPEQGESVASRIASGD
jgi:hypothetical protein